MLCGEKGEVAVTKMLTVVCFVYRGRAGGGSDEDADSGVLCVQGKGGIVTVVCFAFRGNVGGGGDEDADIGVLCVQEKSGRRQ